MFPNCNGRTLQFSFHECFLSLAFSGTVYSKRFLLFESLLFLLPSYAKPNLAANSSRVYLFGLQWVDFSLFHLVCSLPMVCLFKIILVATVALLCNALWPSGKGLFSRWFGFVVSRFYFTFSIRACLQRTVDVI